MIKMIISVTGDMGKNLSEIEAIQVKILRDQKTGDTTPAPNTLQQTILLSKAEVDKICQILKNMHKNNIYFRFSKESMAVFIKKPFNESEFIFYDLSPYQILCRVMYEAICKDDICDNCAIYDKAKRTCLLADMEIKKIKEFTNS